MNSNHPMMPVMSTTNGTSAVTSQPDSTEVDQASNLSTTIPTLPFSVRVSVDQDECQMRAIEVVTQHAIDGIGRLTRHREAQTISTLSSADAAIQAALENGFASREVSEHLSKMRVVYFDSLATVNNNAIRRLTTAANRRTGRTLWFVSSVLRVIGSMGSTQNQPARFHDSVQEPVVADRSGAGQEPSGPSQVELPEPIAASL